MTQIKKILDKQGNEVYLRTHTKAEVDNNGYTAESRLQAMQNEINAAQMEIGAVPSDLTPTKDSTNWVTSGGVYNALSGINVELFGKKVYNKYTEGKYFYQDTGAVNNDSDWAISSDYIPCSPSDTIRVIFGTTGKVNYACLSVYASDKTWIRCRTTNGYTTERTTTVGDESNIGYVRFCFYLPNIEQCEAYINGELVWSYTGETVIGIRDILNNIDTEPTKNSQNLVTSGGVFDAISPIDDAVLGKHIYYTGYETGKYLKHLQDGTGTDSSWAYTTDYIPCKKGDAVRAVFGRVGVADIASVVFYDTNKAYVQSATSNGYTNERTVDVPNNDSIAYCRCNLSPTNIANCGVYINGDLTWYYQERASEGLVDNITDIEDAVDTLQEDVIVKTVDDLGSLAENTYIIVASGKWASTAIHSFWYKEVTPGETYRILSNASNASYYAFLKDLTRTAGGTPTYADGENGRYQINANTESPDFVIPPTTNYLYICNINDQWNQKPQALYRISKAGDAIKSISEDVAEIKTKIGMDGSSSNGFSYYGEKISFYNTMSYTQYSNNSVAGQSSAIYGDYLFIIKDKLTNVICYNMATRTVLYNLATGLSKDSTWHCNQCQFGTLKYSQDDMFPVLYITVNNNAQGRCSWVAYRIIPTLTDNEISSFTIDEVQTIYLPAMTDVNCLGNFNIAVDAERNVLWGYGRNNNSGTDTSYKARFACFPMPALSSATVTYEDSDIIDSFSDTWNMSYAQGGFIKNGKLVIMQGYESVNLINLRVIDLYVAKRQVSYANLLENGFTDEPEGVFFYNGNIYTSTDNTKIWKIVL